MTYNFKALLKEVCAFAESLGFKIVDDQEMDRYYKGDMDGVHIITCSLIDDEEELFNVLHMIGHSIQWNIDEDLRKLGSVLYQNPSDSLLKKLQDYEWEANCYALEILHKLGITGLDIWLYDKYQKDMYYLTHFYKTGEKLREITPVALRYAYIKLLVPKEIPSFTPYASENTRQGLVINF